MRRNRKNERGSITVMVTLLLVPTILMNTFLVELAQLKLCGNQAAMTADTYAVSILTLYQDVLKDLYGFFGVAGEGGQNMSADEQKEMQAAISTLTEYLEGRVASSFNPNQNTPSFQHLTDFTNIQYKGFMPYKDVDMELDYQLVGNSHLRGEDIFYTQIGDFMRFRIVQALQDDATAILDVVQQVQDATKYAGVIKAKDDFDKALETMINYMQEYYRGATAISNFPVPKYLEEQRYLRNRVYAEMDQFGQAYQDVKAEWESCTDPDEKYNLKEQLDDLEEEMKETYETYEYVITMHPFPEDGDDWRKINFTLYLHSDGPISTMENALSDMNDQLKTLLQAQATLEAKLEELSPDDELRKGIEEDLGPMNRPEMFKEAPWDLPTYGRVIAHINDQTTIVRELQRKAEENLKALGKIMDAYLKPSTVNAEEGWPAQGPALTTSPPYEDFLAADSDYKKLYDFLKEMFEHSGNSDLEKAKNKQNAAKGAAEKYELKEDPGNGARDIPTSIPIGKSGRVSSFKLADLIAEAAMNLSGQSLAETGNELLLKFYLANYDFAMFSNRLTNYRKPLSTEEQEAKKTLTGYEISEKLNYLYKAELEYLFGGYKSSQSNLNSTRNTILSFRAVVNYAATYQVKPINTAIRTIANLATMAGQPGLAIIIAAALRLSVATIETYWDWEVMMMGEDVYLFKTKMSHLSSKEAIMAILGEDLGRNEGVSNLKEIKLGYEDYLMVLLLFLTSKTTLASRTADLIDLNVNLAMDGELTALNFQMGNTYTAVTASCSFTGHFIIMPDAMFQSFADRDTQRIWEKSKENRYVFTVTRGY